MAPAPAPAPTLGPAPPELTIPEAKAPRKSPPAHVVGGFSMVLPEVVLQPGDEWSPCYIAPLEIEGPSRVVGGGKVTVGPGMHHGNVTARAKTGEGLRPCPDESGPVGGEASDILEGGSVLFGSSTQVEGTEWQSLPDGLGYPVGEETEIVARMHYLNTTAEPLTIAPVYEWFTIDEAKVTHVLAPFVWMIHSFEIPPNSELTVVGGCKIPGPMNLVNVLPHMHKLGTAFTAEFMGGELDGERFLDSKGYDPENGVILQYDPALDVSLGDGDGVRFACTWQNTFDKVIVEGKGDNEMCMLFGYSYPADSAYSALATGENGCVAIAAPPPE